MTALLLSETLEQEHKTVDAGIERFTHAVADGLRDSTPLAEALTLLRRHIYVEEEFLFPPLREAGMVMPILVMIKEHGEIWNLMDQLQTAESAAADKAELIGISRQLLDALDRHNAKEEPIIYPEVDVTLNATLTAELQEFLADGSMPEGWVCEKAS